MKTPADTRKVAPVPAGLEDARTGFLAALRARGCAVATLTLRHGSLTSFFAALVAAGIDDVRAVTREHVRAYALGLIARGQSPATQNARLATVRSFFAHLISLDAVLVDPCAGLQLARLPRRLPARVLTPGQARRLLRAADVSTARGLMDQALLEMFYSTGLRLAEMAALCVHDVDWREGFVRVRRGKGGKERIVPMGDTARAALRRYLHDVRAKWLAQAARPGDALWLASVRPHQPMKSQAIYWRVKHLSIRAGLRITPHVWRHSCATHLVSAGANLFAVQRQLGHRSLRTTQLYTRVTVPDLKRTLRTKHPRATGPGPADALASGGVAALPPRRKHGGPDA